MVAALSVSCMEVDDNLGSDFMADNQLYDFYATELDLKEVQMRQVDSLTAYSDNRITFGSIREDTFGLTRRGCVITLVPLLQEFDFGKNPKFQKFKFNCAMDSTSVYDLSQSDILQSVNVYPLTEPVSDEDYFSQAPVKHSDRKVTKGTPVVNGSDSLVFELSEEYGRQYLNITNEDLKDMTAYKKKFPGIYLCTDDPEGNGGRINMFEKDFFVKNVNNVVERTNNYAVLYYSGEYDGVRKDSLLVFFFSPPAFENIDSLLEMQTPPKQYVFNVDYHEKSAGMEGPAKDKIYVEGGSGIKPVVTSRQIRDLICEDIRKNGGDPKTTVISKATIEFPFTFPDDYTTMFRYPDNLSPTIKLNNNGMVTYAGLTDASIKTENQGDINRSQCMYSPDMTHHVQQIVRLSDNADFSRYDIWFLIMWYKTTSTYNSEANELAEYYQQLAYYSYYNQIYGGGYYGSGYSSYGSSAYSSYYSYMMMAQYAASAANVSSTNAELDKDHYYNAVLNGPESEGRRPKIKVTYAIPKK